MNNFNLEKFFYYDELDQAAQQQAKINIMLPEIAAREESIAHWKMFISIAKTNEAKKRAGWKVKPDEVTIHTLINNRLHHKRFVNGSQAYYKVKAQGDKYLIPYIRSNRTIFTDKGDYVYLGSNSQIEIISNGEVYHLNNNDEKQLARQAYIDVNARGPAYHDWLYRMHHRIKHFMIR